MTPPPVIELSDVVKDYRGLRPLRLQRLTVAAGEAVAIVGLDGVTAEVFINLVTGATLPDRGEVSVFGRSTASIDQSNAWLAIVDRFGIVSERAALLDGLSPVQNLSMPYTLDIEPPPDEVRERAERLARMVELPESSWSRPLGELGGADRTRVRVGRAFALDPAVILLEHANAGMSRDEGHAVAARIRAMASASGAAIVSATADPEFAAAVASRVLTLEPASGRLKEGKGAGWFRRRLG